MGLPAVARREISPTTYRRITIVALWALCAIVVTGAAVRLTGSGLGCSRWPNCEDGHIIAPLEFRPMVEFINRLITGFVSLAVALAVLGSLRRTPRRADLTRWSWLLVVGVVAQIIIGAFVTLSGLAYSVVALHFLVSMGLVAAAAVLVDRAGRPEHAPIGTISSWGRGLLGLATLLFIVGSAATSAGPHAGDPSKIKRLPLSLSWAVRIHSVVAWCFVLFVVAMALKLRGRSAPLQRRIIDLLIGAVAQGIIGYVQYFSGVPALIVGLHVAGATLVWVLALRVALVSGDHDHTTSTAGATT